MKGIASHSIEYFASLNMEPEARARLFGALLCHIPKRSYISYFKDNENADISMCLCCAEDIMRRNQVEQFGLAIRVLGNEKRWKPCARIPFSLLQYNLALRACIYNVTQESKIGLEDVFKNIFVIWGDDSGKQTMRRVLDDLTSLLQETEDGRAGRAARRLAAPIWNESIQRWFEYQRMQLSVPKIVRKIRESKATPHVEAEIESRSTSRPAAARLEAFSLHALRHGFLRSSQHSPRVDTWEEITSQSNAKVRLFTRRSKWKRTNEVSGDGAMSQA